MVLEPVLGQRIPSFANPAKGRSGEFGRELAEIEDRMRDEHIRSCATSTSAHTEATDGKRRKLYSDMRFVLNGMTLNRQKYTTFSRHFTSPRVLKVIADACGARPTRPSHPPLPHAHTPLHSHARAPRAHYAECALQVIADALQGHLRPGDTFVDFACGLNTFAPLLRDPGTRQPLRSVAFDIFSPIDRTESFTRSAWLQVDAL